MVLVHYLRLCHTWLRLPCSLPCILGQPSVTVVLLSGLHSAGFQRCSTRMSLPVSVSLCLQMLLIQMLILIFKCFHNFLYVCMWSGVEVKLFCILLHWWGWPGWPVSSKDLLVCVPQPRGVCVLPGLAFRGCWNAELMFSCLCASYYT